MCIRLLRDLPSGEACQCAGRADAIQSVCGGSPAPLARWPAQKRKGRPLTSQISRPKINSGSLQGSGRKRQNCTFLNYKSISYPNPNLGHCDKLCTSPDTLASGLSNRHLILFSLPPPPLLLHLAPSKIAFMHLK